MRACSRSEGSLNCALAALHDVPSSRQGRNSFKNLGSSAHARRAVESRHPPTDKKTTTYPLAQAGIEQTLELVTHQRGIRPFAGNALLLDGELYSSLLPKELRDLAAPPRFATGAYRRVYEERFNQRARWRHVRHAVPDADGSPGGVVPSVPASCGAGSSRGACGAHDGRPSSAWPTT
jgi:hypothetical protein